MSGRPMASRSEPATQKINAMKKIILLLQFFWVVSVFGQKAELLSGPMLGYCTMNEVMIWVQTKSTAKVKVHYYTEDGTQSHWTNEVQTKREEGYTAHLIADSIKPSTIYLYDVYVNGKKVDLGFKTSFKTKTIWRYRTDPPTFKFAAGSGAYLNEKEFDRPGKPYGGQYEIYETIAAMQPDFMLWLGDNIYLRQNEWNSMSGFIHRYTHTRTTPELKKLLALTYNYAIWDDHDFGPNDSDGSFAYKAKSLKAFKYFWANPSYGLPGVPGAFTYFNWNDVDFFLLDNRFYRDPNHLKADNKTQLGKAQLEWLKRALVASKASFKFVVIGGQFLTTAKKFETYSNYGFDKERQEIIDFIYEQNIKNVVFLTGDRHFTELSIMKKEGKPTIYDLTLSPLTSGPNTHALEEENKYRVDGTVVMERNFGMIEFTGPFKERKMIIHVYDVNGKELWQKEIEKQ